MNSIPSIAKPSMAVLVAMLVLASLSEAIYTPAFTSISQELGITPHNVQLTTTAYLLAFAIGQFIFGVLADRYGRRKLYLSGIIIFILGTIYGSFAHDLDSLMLARICQGIGGCAGAVLVRTIFIDAMDERGRKLHFPILMGINALAPLMGPVIGGFIVSGFGWRAIFYFLNIISVIVFCVALRYLHETLAIENRQSLNLKKIKSHFMATLTNQCFIRHAIVGSILLGVSFVYALTAPFLIMTQLHFSTLHFSYLLLVTAGAYIIGSLCSAKIALHFTQPTVILMGTLLCLVCSVIMLIWNLVAPLSIYSLLIPMMGIAFGVAVAKAHSMIAALRPFTVGIAFSSAILGGVQVGLAGLMTVIIRFFDLYSAVPMAAYFVIAIIVALWVYIPQWRKPASSMT